MDEEVQGDGDPRDGGEANELCVAEEGSSSMVIGMQEGYSDDYQRPMRIYGACVLLNGFFFSTRKTVSTNSTNLVR